MALLTDNLKAHVDAGAERHEISAAERILILKWIEATDDPTAILILDQVGIGLMELAGWNGKEPTFKLAAAGMAHVRTLMKRHGAKSPAELLGLPEPEGDDEKPSVGDQ